MSGLPGSARLIPGCRGAQQAFQILLGLGCARSIHARRGNASSSGPWDPPHRCDPQRLTCSRRQPLRQRCFIHTPHLGLFEGRLQGCREGLCHPSPATPSPRRSFSRPTLSRSWRCRYRCFWQSVSHSAIGHTHEKPLPLEIHQRTVGHPSSA